MSTLKHLIHNMIESNLVEYEQIFEMVEMLELDEAVNSFNELPAAWKKKATSDGLGGKDSKVETLAATKKIKDANSILTVLRKALKTEGSALVWIEMNGDPLVAVNKSSYDNIFTLMYPQGDFVGKEVKIKHHNTGKWVRRLDKYIPASYYNHVEKNFKPREVVEEMWSVAYKTIKNINDSLETPRDSVFELAQEMKFEVRSLTVDENRKAVKAKRAQLKGRTGLGLGKAPEDSITKNRKDAVKKMVMAKIQPITDKIRSDIEAELEKAISGEKYNFNVVDEHLKKINRISSALNGYLKGSGKFTQSSWNDEKPVEKSFDIKWLVDALKDI